MRGQGMPSPLSRAAYKQGEREQQAEQNPRGSREEHLESSSPQTSPRGEKEGRTPLAATLSALPTAPPQWGGKGSPTTRPPTQKLPHAWSGPGWRLPHEGRPCGSSDRGGGGGRGTRGAARGLPHRSFCSRHRRGGEGGARDSIPKPTAIPPQRRREEPTRAHPPPGGGEPERRGAERPRPRVVKRGENPSEELKIISASFIYYYFPPCPPSLFLFSMLWAEGKQKRPRHAPTPPGTPGPRRAPPQPPGPARPRRGTYAAGERRRRRGGTEAPAEGRRRPRCSAPHRARPRLPAPRGSCRSHQPRRRAHVRAGKEGVGGGKGDWGGERELGPAAPGPHGRLPRAGTCHAYSPQPQRPAAPCVPYIP